MLGENKGFTRMHREQEVREGLLIRRWYLNKRSKESEGASQAADKERASQTEASASVNRESGSAWHTRFQTQQGDQCACGSE